MMVVGVGVIVWLAFCGLNCTGKRLLSTPLQSRTALFLVIAVRCTFLAASALHYASMRGLCRALNVPSLA